MDILIKSFNRPYCLDRCIQSIYANVLDTTISIKVLDDGTPSRYLEKLQIKYPKILIYKSSYYNEKSEAIDVNREIESLRIPIDLWINAAKDATDYFLLLEDDFQFTKKINLEETQKILQEENIYLLKLIWLNNPKLINGSTIKTKGDITIYKPDLFVKRPIFHRLIFGTTRYKIRRIMSVFKVYSKDRALHYYSIYNVAGAVFKKDYFLTLWNDHENQVDENLQLRNAVKFLYKNSKIQFARTTEEYVATGFLSSASNKNFAVGNFDVFVFNKILNQAWFVDQFNMNDDTSEVVNLTKIEGVLSAENNFSATVQDWNKWVFLFKQQFRKIGCNI